MHVNLPSGCRVAAANVVKLQNVQIYTGHFMKPRFVFKKCKCLGRPHRLPGRTEARGRPLPASGSSWNGTEGPAVPWFPSIPASAPGERRQGADLQRGYGGTPETEPENTYRRLFAARVRVLLQERNQGWGGFCRFFRLEQQTSLQSYI